MRKFLICIISFLFTLISVACSNNYEDNSSSINGNLFSSGVVNNSTSLENSSESSSSQSSNVSSSSSNGEGGNDEGSSSSKEETSEQTKPIEPILPSEPEVLTKTYLVSTVDSLCVRSSNSTSSSVLGYLDKGDIVSFVSKQGDFYKTKFKEKTAYVSTKYCNKVEFEVSSDDVEKTIDIASTLLGHPYVYGSERYHWGNGKLNSNFEKGKFDCSALVQYVYFLSCGVLLDLTSRAQSLNGVKVERSDLTRGDLMFFTNDSRKNKTGIERIGHVGIYFGENYILHTASDHAVIEEISPKRWSYYVTARRVV